jgi:xylan 1,4-beta-xylosidase
MLDTSAIKRTRCADQGDGTYINPILFGLYADITIIRDNADYYMVHSNITHIFHSQDLINWEPIFDMKQHLIDCGINPLGGNLYKIDGLYYYYGDEFEGGGKSYVLTATDITKGNWSKPTWLGEVAISDDGFLFGQGIVVDQDGSWYQYVCRNHAYPLAKGGLARIGPLFKVEGADIEIPDEWDIELLCIEETDVFLKDDWFYMTYAFGGTAGPPTGHGMAVFRSRTALGPWEASPYNPLLHTFSKTEKWWSKGRGRFIDTPDGEWYVIYHAILNGYRGQGRMTLLEPIEWTADGWPKIPDGQLPEDPLPIPKNGKKVTHGFSLTDNFKSGKLKPGWNFLNSCIQKRIQPRISFSKDGLVLQAQGTALQDTDVLQYDAGFKAFEIIAELTVEAGAGGGVAMYFNPSHSFGISLKDGIVKVEGHPLDSGLLGAKAFSRIYAENHVFLKVIYKDQITSPWFSSDGKNWIKINACQDVEGYSLHSRCSDDPAEYWYSWIKPAIYAYGKGKVTFQKFEIIPLDETI